VQLTLEDKYRTYYLLKSQLLKWFGNKQKFVVEITKYFPTEWGRYFGPFLESDPILATVAPHNGIGSDTFKPLMEIWKMLKRKPKERVNWYAERRNKIGKETKEEVYAKVLASCNTSPNGADFLFLTRSYYGG